ncbi:MAG TPA: methyltransferase domain-containing protein [Acidimicrobiales bacterium]|nr:methyltransferase domain-containing protein [Acidimicrobiales bacterium]
MTPDTYSHGHHESVLRSHTWRTAENSAPHLIGLLEPGRSLLDVGCGPATITADLARRVAPGPVVGIDASADVVVGAVDTLGEDLPDNLDLRTGDVYDLAFDDGSFDIVHAHQVLQHLSDPVAALRQMRRVLRPDGVLAVRDSDYAGFFWWPADVRLDRWLDIYHRITACNGAEADAGRRLPEWVAAAGFSDLRVTSSTWTFADPDSRSWWGGLWADRVLLSAFAEQAVAYGLADRAELEELARGWRSWAEAPEGVFVTPHVEVIAGQVT